jgi:hypothetical protein
MKTMGFTRIEEIGPYFNLFDACLLLSIIACFMDYFSRKKPFYLPKLALAILAVLCMGVINSWLSFGMTYGVLRSFRWALELPILFIVAANMVDDEKRVKALLLTLVFGTFAAGCQQFFATATISETLNIKDPGVLRTSLFELSSPEIWLIAGPFIVAGRVPKKWLQLAIGTIFAASLFITQNRSVAFGLFLSLLVFHVWFLRGPYSYHLKRLFPLLIILSMALFLLISFSLTGIAQNYWDRLTATLKHVHTDSSLDSRKGAIQVESQDWLSGNILIGRGLDYFGKKYPFGVSRSLYPEGVAFGHVGYVTYLSQLGLIGFLVYALWFPATLILKARRVFGQYDLSPVLYYFAALAGACFIYKSLWFIFTNSYLTRHIYPGILAGSIWRISLLVPAWQQELSQPAQKVFFPEPALQESKGFSKSGL